MSRSWKIIAVFVIVIALFIAATLKPPHAR
jgi:hypothetical protein